MSEEEGSDTVAEGKPVSYFDVLLVDGSSVVVCVVSECFSFGDCAFVFA